jgi:transcriptional regulator with AAA-type ATPase domain/tetratricopeptide (TPR) repeat protein
MTASLEALKGRSPRIEAIRRQVARLLARQTSARRLPPVLILGETGTGKGLLARTIHQAGPRRDGPFVDINCVAIPETLLEAELFGYERGAFTDARHAKPGLFQTAHGGTLFFDEIGLLPAALQGKVLPVLEDRAVRRLGSTRAEPVDVALVAATSVDLPRAVADGRFREDLYHRLAVITIELPPLRTRGMDILALADHFLACACADYGLSPRALTPEARDVLVAYRWPGNVRELANAMERVALLSDRDEITPGILDFLMPNEVVDRADTGALEATLRARIEGALRDGGGNIRRTAAALGISRNTLRARMNKYGLRHHDSAVPRMPRHVRESVPRVAPWAPQWDRRHLSFLRVRLLTSSTVDVASALEVVGEKVRTFGGRIEESSPTGVIAVFGLEPVDNAPSHAALAALAIQNAAARALTAGSGGADVVMAIHCAEHVVDRHDSTPVIGVDGKADTWSILERLVAADVSSAIFISGPVVPFLVRRFALERVQDERNAWLLLRLEEVSAGWPATRFVGRSSELNALRHTGALAEQRHGQIVGIVGEAGVGKSRLVREAVQHFQGWLLLSCGGAPYMKDTPYFPLVELLKSLCHIQDMDAASEVRERVTRALPADADPHSVLPPILDLLRVLPLDDPFRDVDPAQRRKRTHDAARQVFLAASMSHPLCLIFEDLQWIDLETQEVLDSLVNSMARSRVLLLLNYRPGYQHPWGSKTYYSQMRLDALPVESAGELLDALLGHDLGLAPLKQLLVKRGNPFFLEETVRMLVETNALAGERGRYRLMHPVQAIQIPPTVQAMLAARIDRLPPEVRHLLQIASVVGKDVPFALLQAVTDVPDEALRRGLDRLQAAEFVYETGLFPDLEYSFKHALTHEVTYGSLPHEGRRALHARIMESIERLHADRLDEHADELAYHALRGEVWDRAVDFLTRAATAASRIANADAVAYYEQALAALRHLPEDLERRKQAGDLDFELGRCLYCTGHFDRAMAAYRDSERLGLALVDEHRVARACTGLAYLLGSAADHRGSIEAGERALVLATRAADPALEIWASVGMAREYFAVGDYQRGIERARATLDALELTPTRTQFRNLPPSVDSRTWLALCLASIGQFAESVTWAEAATELADRAEGPHAQVWANYTLGRIQCIRGDFAQALAFLERAASLLERGQFPIYAPRLLASLGTVYTVTGRPKDGLAFLERAVAEGEANRVLYEHAMVLIQLGEAHLGGNLEEAERRATYAFEFARQHGERGNEAWAVHLLSRVAAAHPSGHDDAALTHATWAMTLAKALGMRPLVAHCHLGLGKLYRRMSKRDEAGYHITTATTMYRAMDMRFCLEQAEAEMS